MGRVYLAREERSGLEVVAKILLPRHAGATKLITRLRLESETLERLSHPNIVQVLDFGETQEGLPFIVMEKLTGCTLERELYHSPRPPLLQSLQDGRQVLLGLQEAHLKGLVHRDIKPSNVFAHQDPGGKRVIKILDFGIVKVIEMRDSAPQAHQLTTTGRAIGTPRYMSPEQAGAQPVDGRSDLYSVALLLYRLVAGRGPFDHFRQNCDVAIAHMGEVPQPPSVFSPVAVPPELDRLILKGLKKDPDDRFSTAEEFITALDAVAAAVALAKSSEITPQQRQDTQVVPSRTKPTLRGPSVNPPDVSAQGTQPLPASSAAPGSAAPGSAAPGSAAPGSAAPGSAARAPDAPVLLEPPYRAIERIGAGGMGEVWLAQHGGLQNFVVAKLLHPEFASHPTIVERLKREARALAALEHPNIVRVLDFPETKDGSAFLVMEQLRGRTLAEELKAHGVPPVEQAVGDTLAILSALSAAHEVGLVHRDIKPSNVFAHQSPQGRVVKLLDFGIVKEVRLGPGAPALTESGTAMGTPAYMSPEQCKAEKVDLRADLYAVGLVLYELLAGRGPWVHPQTQAQMLLAQALEPAPAPSAVASIAIPGELDAIVLKAIQKEREDRFQTATEFAKALVEVQSRLNRPARVPSTAVTERLDLPPTAPRVPLEPVLPVVGSELSALPGSRELSRRKSSPTFFLIMALLFFVGLGMGILLLAKLVG